jgi:type II secretory pathway component PulJ
MKIVTAAVGTALLLLLLTWLVLRSTNPQIQTSQVALDALDDIAASESALHRDMLSARAGMLLNYDPLVAEEVSVRRSISNLEASVGDDPRIRDAVNVLAATLDQQEEWTEKFKSSNALLRNSLAYFRLFSADLSAAQQDPVLARQVSGLTAAMLHLTLDTSSPVIDEVDTELNQEWPDRLSPKKAQTVHALLAHGRMLRQLLPETDRTLKALFTMRNRQQGEIIRTMVLARVAASESIA